MVKMGLLLSDVPKSVTPAQQFKDVLRIVEAAQANGFTYIAIGQHFLYGELRWLQPVPLLARLAAEVGPDVKLVTQIMIAPLYHPVMLAEEIATLDVVTEGRLIFGAGLGYRPEEFDYFGIPYKQRAGRFDESLELMKQLWTQESVTHDGKYWQLDDVKPHLFPVQDPHPPIWIGAHAIPGVAALREVRRRLRLPARDPDARDRRAPPDRHGRLRRARQGVHAAAAAPQLPGRRLPRRGDRRVRPGRPGPLPDLRQQGPRRHEGQGPRERVRQGGLRPRGHRYAGRRGRHAHRLRPQAARRPAAAPPAVADDGRRRDDRRDQPARQGRRPGAARRSRRAPRSTRRRSPCPRRRERA